MCKWHRFLHLSKAILKLGREMSKFDSEVCPVSFSLLLKSAEVSQMECQALLQISPFFSVLQ